MDSSIKRGYDSKAELWAQLKIMMKSIDEAKSKGDNQRLLDLENKVESLKQAIKE